MKNAVMWRHLLATVCIFDYYDEKYQQKVQVLTK